MLKKNAPQVSVIMAVYNTQDYLNQAVESILNQTFEDFEFIIINDASSDATSDILKSYRDERICLIDNEENIGQTKSLIKGCKIARGRYIALMDGDDIAFHHRLEKQAAFLDSRPDVGLVGSTFLLIDSAGYVIRYSKLATDSAELKRQLFRSNCFCHASAMFRKRCIEKVGAYREEFKFAQDYDLWLRIVEEFEIANFDEPLCKYRVCPQAISVARRKQQDYYAHLAYSFAIQRQVFGRDKLGYEPPGRRFQVLRQKLERGYFPRRQVISDKYLICARKYASKNKRWSTATAAKYCLKSLIYNPLNLTTWRWMFGRGFKKTKNVFGGLFKKSGSNCRGNRIGKYLSRDCNVA